MTKKEDNQPSEPAKDEMIQQDWENHHTTTDRYPDNATGIAETEVKNAHATGDGSFGRSDENLPDESDGEKGADSY